MRKIIKNIPFLALCLFLLFNLAACSGKNEASEHSSYKEGENNSQAGDPYSSDSGSSDRDTHISTTLSSGVKVNADIVISDTVDLKSLSICDTRLVIQNFEEAKRLLLGNKKIIEEKTEETKESMTNSPYRYCTTSDGFSLASTGGNLYFTGDLYNTISSIFDSTEYGNSDLFLTGKNLDFASIEKAQRDISYIIQKLNITVGSNPVCYTMDYNTLSTECKKYNKRREDIRGGKFNAISVEKSDECYIFIYQLTPLGMPISTHMNGVFGDGSWTSGTYVQCTYSADGLVGLQINYQFEVIGQNSQNEKGMDARQALEKLDQKYNSIVLEGEYLVDSIEFEYVPMPNYGKSNSYTLVPAWRFSILHTYEEAEKENLNNHTIVKQRNTSVFHAITGTELLIDSGTA